jgi:hypothetical protein
MTPKEKAKELIKKYACLARGESYEDWINKDIVFDYIDCQNTLIAVDEIIAIKLLWYQKDTKELDYWNEVKQEIEKL